MTSDFLAELRTAVEKTEKEARTRRCVETREAAARARARLEAFTTEITPERWYGKRA